MKNHLSALILAAGVALSGFFVYLGISDFSNKDRYVTVRGLSERQVLADKATWSLSSSLSGNDVESLYVRLEPRMQQVIEFLKSKGVTEEEIFRQAPTVYDRSDMYDWEKKRAYMDQYEVSGHLTIVSTDVEKIRNLYLNQLDLMQAGVTIETYNSPSCEYTGLNDLKPEMVEEATRNARIVGDKFAADAKCTLGSIRSARQGQFEVYSDEILPHLRNVRVVTTIEYYLK